MSKDKGKKNGNKRQAKLEKARDRLTELEEAYYKAQAKAEKRILEVQAKAEKSVVKARERMEAQRAIVARREGQVAPVAPQAVVEDADIHSPQVAANRLEAVESNGAVADDHTAGESILLPDTVEASTVLTEGTQPPSGESSDPFRG
jgi:hypothetical protein